MTGKNSIEKQASGTALAAAFMRALAARDPRKEIRGNDYLGEIFPEENQKKPLKDPAVRDWVLQNKLTPGAYEFMIARTAFFDRIVEQALKENIEQVVFLGAAQQTPERTVGAGIQGSLSRWKRSERRARQETALALAQGRRTLGIIEGDAVPQRFIPDLVELYLAGEFPLDRLVKFYDFGDINRALADAGRGVTVKPVLQISGS